MNEKNGNYITEAARLRFKKWLLVNHLTVNSFAKKVGVSRQYLERILSGKVKITSSKREWFKKGGYDLI